MQHARDHREPLPSFCLRISLAEQAKLWASSLEWSCRKSPREASSQNQAWSEHSQPWKQQQNQRASLEPPSYNPDSPCCHLLPSILKLEDAARVYHMTATRTAPAE